MRLCRPKTKCRPSSGDTCCRRKLCRRWSSTHPTNRPPIAFDRRSATRIDRRMYSPRCRSRRSTGICDRSKRLYQEWFFTDEFANREIANIEARLIQ